MFQFRFASRLRDGIKGTLLAAVFVLHSMCSSWIRAVFRNGSTQLKIEFAHSPISRYERDRRASPGGNPDVPESDRERAAIEERGVPAWGE